MRSLTRILPKGDMLFPIVTCNGTLHGADDSPLKETLSGDSLKLSDVKGNLHYVAASGCNAVILSFAIHQPGAWGDTVQWNTVPRAHY